MPRLSKCSDAAKNNKKLAKTIDNIDGQIKTHQGVKLLSSLILSEIFFKESVKEQILMSSAQLNLLINLLSRDGNCVARIS